MKKIAVVLTLSTNRAYAAASVMMDLKRFSPGLADEVIIFHDGIPPADQALLSQILPVKFIHYVFPIKDLSRFSNTITDYFTFLVFSKFETFKLLNDYRCVIMLDYDILIQGDLSVVKNPSVSGMTTIDKTAKRSAFFTEYLHDYSMEEESRIGSIWVLWDHLPNYNEIYEWCYREAERLADKLYLPETGIISLAMENFKFSPDQFLAQELYDCHPSNLEYASEAKILHCWGQPKYWNGYYSQQWEENYSIWLKMGGTPCFERSLKYRSMHFLKTVISKLKRILPSR